MKLLLSRARVTVPPKQSLQLKMIVDLTRARFCLKKINETLNGRLPLEDSSVFDDAVCVLIVMT